MNPNAERARRVLAVFEEACLLPADQRGAFLTERCADDPVCRAQVEALLAQDETPRGPIEADGAGACLLAAQVANDASGPTQPLQHPVSAPVPVLRGQYRILRLIGEGGMGSVYEAEQARPRRLVALKAIRPGPGARRLLKRFEQEVSILGRLHHPGIAQIYEAGAADEERPDLAFFAMELVRGKPITEYAEQARLGVRARLELMAKVCDAVHYAHQNGVIHRDLKPANILVSDELQISDFRLQIAGAATVRGKSAICNLQSAIPKILDFGVARLADDDNTTMHTLEGQLVGTLPYMSPEQVAGHPNDVDTRADVYALGVLLYQLLTGRLPHELRDRAVPDAVRIIRDETPARIGLLDRALRGDVETIVARAMEKEKDRRYAAACDLADDLRRYLHDEPILARPPSALYQLRKLAGRHRVVVAGLVLILVSLVGGAMATSLEAYRATRERERAERAEHAATLEAERARTEARKSDRITRFFQNMLTSADPNRLGAKDVTVRELLDRAAETVGPELANEPQVEAAVRYSIGLTYRSLARYSEAESQLRRALQLRREVLGNEHPDVTAGLHSLGLVLSDQGRREEALQVAAETVELRRKLVGEKRWEYGAILALQGDLLRGVGKYNEAEAATREALDVLTAALGREHAQVVPVMNSLGLLLHNTYRYAEAETVFREAVDLAQRVYGREHVHTGRSAGFLALLLHDQDGDAEAEALLRESLAAVRRYYGDDHPETAQQMGLLADVLAARGDSATAESFARAALENRRRTLPLTHVSRLASLLSLSEILLAGADPAKAEEAVRLLDEAADVLRQHHPQPMWQSAHIESLRGHALTIHARFKEAEPLLLNAYPQIEAAKGARHRETRNAIQRIVQLYEAWGKPDEAAAYRARLP